MKPLIITVGCLLTIPWLSCSNDGQEVVISPGQGIRHDDFLYAVSRYDVVEQIASEPPSPDKRIFIVHFKTTNRAARVAHVWNNTIAYIVDETGAVYENLATLQQTLNEQQPFGLKEEYITPAEHADSTVLVFQLPITATQPHLMVRGETLLGDLFSDSQFRRTKVKLF